MRPEDNRTGRNPIHPSAGKLAEGGNYAGMPEVACEAQRQKYWSELQEHERIERLREVIKHGEARLEMAEAFIRSLMEHRHDASGALTGPLDPSRHMPKTVYSSEYMDKARAGEQANPDAVYF